jgi:hypothetical protein
LAKEANAKADLQFQAANTTLERVALALAAEQQANAAKDKSAQRNKPVEEGNRYKERERERAMCLRLVVPVCVSCT